MRGRDFRIYPQIDEFPTHKQRKPAAVVLHGDQFHPRSSLFGRGVGLGGSLQPRHGFLEVLHVARR